MDIRRVTLNSLRSQIGIVLQETTLFATTIRENIAFGSKNATEEDIIQAARAAQAHDFIMQNPDGYQTRVGERGATLSGGQKQRLAIARAILMNPRILILDDATASVDTETEHLIQQAFERLIQGRTTFVIAHRLSTVRNADLILVLDAGRISAQGTHENSLEYIPHLPHHLQSAAQEAGGAAVSFSIGPASPGMGPRSALDHFGSTSQQGGKVYNPKVVSRMLCLSAAAWLENDGCSAPDLD